MAMRTTLVFTVSCLGACGSLVGADYGGEPLFRLQGLAATRRSDPVSSTGVEAAALWQGTSARAAVLAPMPLDIAFPTFWIDVVAAPSDEVVFQLAPEEPPIAEAYLHIVKPDRLAHPGELLASDYEHALVYVGAAVPPDGVTTSYLGGPLEPGFHVMVRQAVSELTAAQQILVDRCVAEATDAPPAIARANCTAERLYRLDRSPADLQTLLHFSLSPGA
jgi:hypothetical protein